jgi:hypothetical protein
MAGSLLSFDRGSHYTGERICQTCANGMVKICMFYSKQNRCAPPFISQMICMLTCSRIAWTDVNGL